VMPINYEKSSMDVMLSAGLYVDIATIMKLKLGIEAALKHAYEEGRADALEDLVLNQLDDALARFP
jgi:hypothetical protein